MSNLDITSSGTYTVADGNRVKIDIPGGGDVTLQAPAGDDNVDKLTIGFEDNDNQSDVVTIDLSTFDEDGLHIHVRDYDPSHQIILLGGTITGVDPNNSSKLTFTYVGEDGQTYTGVLHLKDGGEKDFTDPNSPIIICFSKGSMILTDKGEVPIENLKAGDMILTRDCGLQPICWVGSRQLDSIDLALNPNLFPIRISKGALGPNIPTRDLWVSPQHRINLGGAASQLLFGIDDVLVAAKHLINGTTIISDTSVSEVTYFHILFDRHQIMYSGGCQSESLHSGEMAITALGQQAADDVFALFPELAEQSSRNSPTTLPVLNAYEARAMLAY
ncbi:MAG: Hint domain-containing protein [Halocynthiibacter sp.]